MAYNSYFPAGYQPIYYQPQYQPPQQPALPPAQAQAQANNQNNGLIWVQGEAGAKSYLVAPNNTVMLMDSESERFYLKSTDASGMPLPLRTFEYKEVGGGQKQAISEAKNEALINNPNYVLKSEFEALRGQVEALLAGSTPTGKHERVNGNE